MLVGPVEICLTLANRIFPSSPFDAEKEKEMRPPLLLKRPKIINDRRRLETTPMALERGWHFFTINSLRSIPNNFKRFKNIHDIFENWENLK